MNSLGKVLKKRFTVSTHHQRGHAGHQRVQEHRRDRARLLRSKVRLRVRAVMAEKALDVYVERVRVLKVIRQHDRPCHDDQLKVKHRTAERTPRSNQSNQSYLTVNRFLMIIRA